jgi:hypothetical protein
LRERLCEEEGMALREFWLRDADDVVKSGGVVGCVVGLLWCCCWLCGWFVDAFVAWAMLVPARHRRHTAPPSGLTSRLIQLAEHHRATLFPA